MAGANDLIRPGLDLDLTLELMDDMQSKFRAGGAAVLSNTYPVAPGSGPFGHRVSDRFRAYNEGLREIAERHGTLLIDLETIPSTTDPRLWSHDRLHLNPAGHERLALAALALVEGAAHGRTRLALDSLQAGDLPAWARDLPPAAAVRRATEVRRNMGWVFRYLLPWVGRRLTGRSSGDGRSAKRPALTPVAASAGTGARAAESASDG